MKSIWITLIMSVLLCLKAQAAVITVTDADLDPDAGQNGIPSEGTFNLTQNIVDGAAPQNLIYTITGLTIDGTGSGDDSVAITFTGTTEGGPLQSGENNSSQGFLSSGGVWLNALGEYVQLEFTDISVNLSGGTDNGWGAFDGFTRLQLDSWEAGDEAEINGNSITFDGGDTGPSFAISNADFVKLEYFADGGSAGQFRMREWDFQFTALESAPATPEPGTLGLVSIFGALLYAMRKSEFR